MRSEMGVTSGLGDLDPLHCFLLTLEVICGSAEIERL